jgi:hypothetical protein
MGDSKAWEDGIALIYESRQRILRSRWKIGGLPGITATTQDRMHIPIHPPPPRGKAILTRASSSRAQDIDGITSELGMGYDCGS